MVTKMNSKIGDNVPMHSHPNEQSGYVISGKYSIKCNETDEVLVSGDSYSIPETRTSFMGSNRSRRSDRRIYAHKRRLFIERIIVGQSFSIKLDFGLIININNLKFMRMNDVLHMRIFSLLAEPSQTVTNEEMHNAYAQFIVHIEGVSNFDDYTNIFRIDSRCRRTVNSYPE